jgi:hypothetical protein
MGMAATHELGHNDLERLVDWFTYSMPMDQRHRLMADMPLVYARLFPGVRPAAVTEEVAVGIEAVREEQRIKRATQLDGMLAEEMYREDTEPELDPALTEPPF